MVATKEKAILILAVRNKKRIPTKRNARNYVRTKFI